MNRRYTGTKRAASQQQLELHANDDVHISVRYRRSATKTSK
ncbi:hypothetical protein ACFFK0_00560 [Paenibacillus chartarius]|uniref:Uncharacterized protein n=1 Tax=Paenibacillus chartarius TaxID=747481 RepID=A0ABV6DE83_9BACL